MVGTIAIIRKESNSNRILIIGALIKKVDLSVFFRIIGRFNVSVY